MYFNFIWKICEQIPRFITNSSSNRLSDQSSEQQKIDTISSNESVLLAAKLGILFLLEAYIHARDKPNMLQWIDLLTRLFNSNKQACQWLITYLSTEPSCDQPSAPRRRRPQQQNLFTIFLVSSKRTKTPSSLNTAKQRQQQQKSGLSTLNDTSRANIRFMSEYFTFLIEFSRSGIKQCLMLIKSGAIIKCPEFYLNSRRPPNKKLDLSHKSAKAISRSQLKSKQPLKARVHQQQQSQKKRNKRKKKKMNSKQDMVSDTESINSVCSSSSQLLSTSSSSTASWSAASSTTSSILSSFLSSSSSSSSSDGDTASSSSLSDDDHDEVEEDDDDKDDERNEDNMDDIIPIHDQNSKLKVFEKIIALIAHLVGMNTQYQNSVHHHPDSSSDPNKKLAKAKNQKLNLNFFYKSILDDINIKNVRNTRFVDSCQFVSLFSSRASSAREKTAEKSFVYSQIY